MVYPHTRSDKPLAITTFTKRLVQNEKTKVIDYGDILYVTETWVKNAMLCVIMQE